MGKTDSHKNAEVRGVLEPIGEFAERLRVAILSVTHFSKSGANTATKALHRFIGSIAFVGAPRIALAVIEDSENDRRLLLHAKNNLAPPPQGLAFRIKETSVGEPGRGAVVSSCAVWDPEPVTITANEALVADAAGSESRTAREEAEGFLSEILASSPMSAKQVKAQAEAAGMSWGTVRRAKDRMGIKPRKAAMNAGWVWELPKMLKSHEDAHVLSMSTFGKVEHLRDRSDPLSGCGIPDLPAFLDRRTQE
jgi:hypothetical protein